MAHVVRVHEVGGPEVLTLEEMDIDAPPPGRIKIRQHACGVNYIDTYFRNGLYGTRLPLVPGNEGAGEVIAVGDGVHEFEVGDRVTYTTGLGGYSSERILKTERVLKLPGDISYEQAAGMMLKGLTAQYLLHSCYKVQQGDTILVHAAAGGVGQILTQWASLLGAIVIGTVGSAEKADVAKANGCSHVILYRQEDFVTRVKEITNGKLCDVVYDGIGNDTFPASLSCIRPRGTFVSFGNASGPIKTFEIGLLSKQGSLFATRPALDDFISTRDELMAAAISLFDIVERGALKIPVAQRYALADARQAHCDLESRATTGSSILVP